MDVPSYHISAITSLTESERDRERERGGEMKRDGEREGAGEGWREREGWRKRELDCSSSIPISTFRHLGPVKEILIMRYSAHLARRALLPRSSFAITGAYHLCVCVFELLASGQREG